MIYENREREESAEVRDGAPVPLPSSASTFAPGSSGFGAVPGAGGRLELEEGGAWSPRAVPLGPLISMK